MEEVVFTAWLGENEMTANRKVALETLPNTGLDVQLITLDNLGDWILPDHQLHPAWAYLSAIDRADYLGAYLMHHFGGGYSDLKRTGSSWLETFRTVQRGGFVGAGYPEVGRWGVAQFDLDGRRDRFALHRSNWWRWRWLQFRWRSLIGNGAYIFLPRTAFTSAWLTAVERQLDAFHHLLRAHPAKDPRERRGSEYHGEVSQYPLNWAHLHADIFHPLVLRYHRSILQTLPPPKFGDYL